MPGSGNCACGNVAYEYSEPAITALCHCTDCQKWSASSFSSNLAVPTSAFSIVKGTPKAWSRVALVSEKPHLHFFCADCGGHLYSQPEGMPGTTFIKAGSLSAPNIAVAAELFFKSRRGYVQPVVGAQQIERMP